MYVSITLKQSQKTLKSFTPTTLSAIEDIQDALVNLAVEYIRKHRPNAKFSDAEVDFMKAYQEELFFEFAKKLEGSMSVDRYMSDKAGNTYSLSYEIKRTPSVIIKR